MSGLPSGELKKPFCTSDLPFSMKSYDHLKGVALRNSLDSSSELGLVHLLPTIIPNVKSVDEFGSIISSALEKVNFTHQGHISITSVIHMSILYPDMQHICLFIGFVL